MRTLTKDCFLFKEGASANSLYVVASGEVEVMKNIAERRRFQLTEALEGTAF